MKRNEIVTELEKHDCSVLSFPDRGPWGSSKWRGNCSGWIQAFVVWKYKVKKLAELFAGSGTGYDVCKDMGISYIGADLNPDPVRPGILNVNAITDPVPDEFMDADMCFMHPPYSIMIPYAGSMYKDPTGELSRSDLGQMSWDTFIKTLNGIIMRYYAAMPGGSRMSILMGDMRKNGLHSMLTDIVKPGELEQIIIKMQHNCVSDGKTYSNRNFVPLAHEYLMVVKKPSGYELSFLIPTKRSADIRDSKLGTWKTIVAAVMEHIGRPATLSEIYSEIEGHERCTKVVDWKAKVRQTLQRGNFNHVEEGVWAMAA